MVPVLSVKCSARGETIMTYPVYLSITPDQLGAAGSYIAREWGDHGYRIEGIESPTHAVSLFHVRCGDGARFIIAADKWGDCQKAADSPGYTSPALEAELAGIVRVMHIHATGQLTVAPDFSTGAPVA
jgi:hypothetical protein